MAQPAVTEKAADLGDVLATLLERFVVQLLEQSRLDGIRGHIGGATLRRLVARDLSSMLAQWREDHDKILKVVGEETLP
jgi:hypothetical protein